MIDNFSRHHFTLDRSTMFARSLNLKPSLQNPIIGNSRIQTVPMGSRMESTSPIRLPQDPIDREGVELLLGIATIVSREMANSGKELFGDESGNDFYENGDRSFPKISAVHDHGILTRSLPKTPPGFVKDDDFAWSRVRTVSIDHGCKSPRRSPDPEETKRTTKSKPLSPPAIVSPVNTRLRTNRKPSLKLLAHKGKKEHVKFPKLNAQQSRNNQNLPNIMSQHKRKALEQSSIKGKSITVIHRKKFSWKNYPELEAFLVANREEYLRHSALNYTIQQKKYNNRLTEQLLDLAAQHQYIFNEEEFSFVTVRDRIRCFYKSYVQSSKKRGIVLGYAARKAGILTQADLQRSARKEGTIINPL
mmetsp:Transcript_24006/g.66522  ORF Transcript_24006/g.66522 Transcript_24006/m.66522 type:complete len:361 (-) Transcript_24006:1877-2959(-)